MRLALLIIVNWLACASGVHAILPNIPDYEIPRYLVPANLEVPAWLKGHENLLPPATLEQVQEMAILLNYQTLVIRYGEGHDLEEKEKLSPYIQQAVSRLYELGENVVPLMLWLYVQD